MDENSDFLLKAYEQAQAAKADASVITALTTDLRAGESTAMAKLVSSLMWFLFEVGYEWTARSRNRRLEDIFGGLGEGLLEATQRLAKNDVPDVERFVRDELSRRIRGHRRENSRDIHAPASTNSYRKTKGLPGYKPLVRAEGCSSFDALHGEAGDIGCVAERPQYTGPDLRDDKGYYRGPSKFFNQTEGVDTVDLLDSCDSSEEREAMTLMLQGYETAAIEIETSSTKYGVGKTRKRIKCKLAKAGIAKIDSGSGATMPTAPSGSTVELAPIYLAGQQASKDLEIAISV